MSYTLVSFHAHPDDEWLLTGGTLAGAAAEGHRVVLVVATCGEAGLAPAAATGEEPLRRRRADELARAAVVLGCTEVVQLGYRDSGMQGRTPGGFAQVPVEQAAADLAAVLRRQGADVLTVYDPAGGYGHPDHVQVHRVGVRAAELAGTPVVLEATVDRRLLQWALWIARLIWRTPPEFVAQRFGQAYAAPDDITHRVDVSAFTSRKRQAMAAHRSQATADTGDRTLAWCLRLPTPLFRLAFGHEWFVERGCARFHHRLDDIFDTLRPARSGSHLRHTTVPPRSAHDAGMALTDTPRTPDASSAEDSPMPRRHRSRALRRMWDARVGGWHRHVFDTPGFAALRGQVLDQVAVAPGERVVDLGAGDGFLSLPLARAGAAVLAVDISPAMLEACAAAAQQEQLSVRTLVADLADLDLPTGSVDVVVSSYALHHLPDSDKRQLLERAHRWLRPGGRLVLADMMIGRGATAADRRVIVAKVRSLARKGPGGIWRIAKNGVRFGLRVGSEQPVSLARWTQWLDAADFANISGAHVFAEAAIVSGTRQ